MQCRVSRPLVLFAAALGMAMGAEAARGQTAARTEFPSDVNSWINSSPISAEMLAGKAAILWFYEEGCPKCREKWPGMLDVAKKFEGKPILFVAVNSGNSRGEVLQYISENKINWPTIVDPDRAFEKLCKVPEVSLQNIYQMQVLTAAGTMRGGNPGDLEGEANRLLADAKWNVDPAEIPISMRPAWAGVEFGNYAASAAAVKKGLASRKPDEKAGAEKLKAAIDAKIAEQVAAGKEAAEAGKKWQAYKAYSSLGQRFKGYDVPAEATAAAKELSEDEAVKGELVAFKILEGAKKLLYSPSATTRKRGGTQLEKLVADSPDSEAAQEAKALLQNP